MSNCTVKFVSQKLSKVRWRPPQSALQKPDIFITGSWDDTKNSIKVWKTPDKIHMDMDDYIDDDIVAELPQTISECNVYGDVCDMVFADSDTILAALGTGCVNALKYSTKKKLSISHKWSRLHGGNTFSTPCTGIAANTPDFATVGEDGTLNILRIGYNEPLRTLDHCDSTPITAVKYITTHEICTTNKIAQVRIYDTRVSTDDPAKILMSSEQLVALESVDRHPTRPHVIATGGADGCITTFDIRGNPEPVTKIEVHEMEVWEVHFHPMASENLFTCSEDGCVRKLNIAPHIQMSEQPRRTQPIVDVIEILPSCGISANSIDVEGSSLLCGSDAESLSIVSNIN